MAEHSLHDLDALVLRDQLDATHPVELVRCLWPRAGRLEQPSGRTHLTWAVSARKVLATRRYPCLSSLARDIQDDHAAKHSRRTLSMPVLDARAGAEAARRPRGGPVRAAARVTH